MKKRIKKCKEQDMDKTLAQHMKIKTLWNKLYWRKP